MKFKVGDIVTLKKAECRSDKLCSYIYLPDVMDGMIGKQLTIKGIEMESNAYTLEECWDNYGYCESWLEYYKEFQLEEELFMI